MHDPYDPAAATTQPAATTSASGGVEMRPSFAIFHLPDRPDLLQGVGEVALRHAHLDHILRMTIKTLAGVTIEEALDATERQNSSVLRERIGKLARARLGEGAPLIKLQALMKRCRDVTEARNELMHAIWIREIDGDAGVRSGDTTKPLPTADELRELARKIKALYMEINEARLEGWLADALRGRANPAE